MESIRIVNGIQEVNDIRATTIVLAYDVQDMAQNRLKMFFCYNCKHPLFQYRGRVIHIHPGGEGIYVPIVLKCDICKEMFAIEEVI